ncbi:hypothetical protein V7S43_009700 [Phytophthora oleae]|uniref:RING-type E3 ubiquitin transferase n=1 Tax=Phytophthora oleae TaxID=2107226 RepID=A0ABD3FH96_9STRA
MEHRTRRRPRPLGLEAPAKECLAQRIASAVALSLQRNRRESGSGGLPGDVTGKRGMLASRLRLARQNVVDMTAYLRRREAETAASVEEQAQVSCCNADVNVCVICLDGNLDEREVEALPCGHVFHARCITQWLLYRRVCPVDRRPVD